MTVLAIDPGNIETAYVVIDSDNYKPIVFGKVSNEEMRDICQSWGGICANVIELVACYGMPVGKEVFDTCVWIGRYYEILGFAELMVRKDVKMNLCYSAKAKDGNIIQALKDRFGDKGTKANQGWFYGFKADCWQAYALGITYIDKLKEKSNAETD